MPIPPEKRSSQCQDGLNIATRIQCAAAVKVLRDCRMSSVKFQGTSQAKQEEKARGRCSARQGAANLKRPKKEGRKPARIWIRDMSSGSGKRG